MAIWENGGEMAAEGSSGLWSALTIAAWLIFLGLCLWVAWIEHRRRVRESFQRSEMLRRLAEAPAEGARAVVEMLREEERLRFLRRLEGMKAGGVVCIGLGLGLSAMLQALSGGEPVFWCGLLPVLAGAALLTYVYKLAREPK